MLRFSAAFVIGVLVSLLSAGFEPAMAQNVLTDEWVVSQSRVDVDETTRRLEDAIVRSGSVVLAVIDNQSAARKVGQQLPPSKLVIFAKPKLATPLIQANPRIGIDLPQRFLVWEENGNTQVGYVSPYSIAARYGIDGDIDELEQMRVALEALAQAAINRGDRR